MVDLQCRERCFLTHSNSRETRNFCKRFAAVQAGTVAKFPLEVGKRSKRRPWAAPQVSFGRGGRFADCYTCSGGGRLLL